MTDRRPSLIDQMALAAALEADIDLSGDEAESSEELLLLDDDDLDHPNDLRRHMVFHSHVPEEAAGTHYEGEENLAHHSRPRHRYSHEGRGEQSDEVNSVHSLSGSEALDDFAEDPLMPLGYQWRPPASNATTNLEDSQVSAFNMASVTENWEGERKETSSAEAINQRPSIKQQSRRSSFQSIQSQSDGSLHSAPARTMQESASPGGGVYGGAGEGEKAVRRSSHSIRRPSVNVKYPTDEDSSAQTSSSGGGTGLHRFGRLSSLGGRRHNLSSRNNSSANGSLDQAIESLTNHSSNSEWENVAAAVTVVAASTQGNGSQGKKRHIQFAVDETVLVLLTLLNVTNMEDPKDTFTVAPVNKWGFPQGEGRSDYEKNGPYTFVLATVKRVHFDEDDRYYTVIRADTGTEQRADSGWMEPLNDPAGIETAARAAKRTVRSAQDKPMEDMDEKGYLQDAWGCLLDALSWPVDFSRSTLLPWYRKQRANTKQQVTHLVFGDAPFACKVRITGINFLVFCSFSFLFLECINLAFLPANYDQTIAIVGTVVWSILVLELVFEIAIRPKGYAELIHSDRAFAPSTARHINRFHLVFETIALITFIPEFRCLAPDDVCTRESMFSRVEASLDSVLGESHAQSARGRFLIGLTALRLFGLIRHWKQMFINNTFRPTQREGIEKWLIPREKNLNDSMMITPRTRSRGKKTEDENESSHFLADENYTKLTSSEEDQRLKNAATIGTALMVVNSQRALILLTSIVLVLPMLQSLYQQNHVADNLVELLQANNLASPSNSTDDCDYLKSTIESWLNMAACPQPASLFEKADDTFVLWAQLLPVRCDFQQADGVITFCQGQGENSFLESARPATCDVWDDHHPENPDDAVPIFFARNLTLRSEGIRRIPKQGFVEGYTDSFNTTVVYNENPSVALANMGDFFLLFGVLLLSLYGLTALRAEAIRLVLDPLQRMLKIVLRYAENPLSQDANSGSNKTGDDSAIDVDAEEIGNYETEQLINAITKIADLLRKCWGVAGAGIISSNLARTKDGKTVVFNPTVPGKRVYALFGFVAINGFSEQLRALDRDVMILINDVAKVVHDEVYRWALGDHGQCNKNLGAAFLMVFRIGDFSEVQKKKRVATEKLFRDNAKNTNRKNANLRRRYTNRTSMGRSPYAGRRGGRYQDDGQLQLASLPGIQAFTDRALLGMLKSFAGVHRDKHLTVWKNDFRLSAGVSAYHVDIIYGMDAGWAVEGAVGSEYKIDATYLSPHVNMASRMMSATKQYGITILLSKAVEELLSRTCRKKLRHLDTVYVKGSKVKQDIFTFDARYQGVDFFLLERTPEQADTDAEAYTPSIWEHDQDLRAMRQHVSDKFLEVYHLGVKQYLSGRWKEAYKLFERADNMMMETVLQDGYLEYDVEEMESRLFDQNDQGEDITRIRNELGDGASRVLMSYMERRQLKPPDDWDAVRQLSSK